MHTAQRYFTVSHEHSSVNNVLWNAVLRLSRWQSLLYNWIGVFCFVLSFFYLLGNPQTVFIFHVLNIIMLWPLLESDHLQVCVCPEKNLLCLCVYVGLRDEKSFIMYPPVTVFLRSRGRWPTPAPAPRWDSWKVQDFWIRITCCFSAASVLLGGGELPHCISCGCAVNGILSQVPSTLKAQKFFLPDFMSYASVFSTTCITSTL